MKELPFFKKLYSNFLWRLGLFQFRIKVVPNNPDPKKIKRNIIYVVGTRDYAKWAYLKCPSKCGEVLLLPLISTNKPSWAIAIDQIGRPTIRPSVNKTDGCKSHFWITRGKLFWV